MKKLDFLFILIVGLLTTFGLLMIYDASSFVAFRDFNDKYHYLKEQAFWSILGFIFLYFFSRFNYKKLYNLALPLILISIALLIFVFVPGVGVYLLGARRWINLGFTVLQPSEFVKLSFAIYLAAWLSKKEKGRFLAFLLLSGLIFFLVILEPDMGTASIILIEAIVVYFLSGARLRHLLYTIPPLGIVGFLLIKLSPYRAQRMASFLNLSQSPQNYSYHVKQILIALGSGGLMGVGIGNSLQKFAYLPENVTDSIFAIVGEEVGFVGAVVIIGLFLFLIWRGFNIAISTKDNFGKLLAGGIITFFSMQIIINLAAQTALIPLTGIPLPFISYGGSAMIINLASIGILLNISSQNTRDL
jgi:cell division protein FtsW